MSKLETFKLHLKCKKSNLFLKLYTTIFSKWIIGKKNFPIWQIFVSEADLKLLTCLQKLSFWKRWYAGGSVRVLSQSCLDEFIPGLTAQEYVWHLSACSISAYDFQWLCWNNHVLLHWDNQHRIVNSFKNGYILHDIQKERRKTSFI